MILGTVDKASEKDIVTGVEKEPVYAIYENYNYNSTKHSKVLGVSKDFKLAKSIAKERLFGNELAETDNYEITYDVVEGHFYKVVGSLKNDKNQYIELVVEETSLIKRK